MSRLPVIAVLLFLTLACPSSISPQPQAGDRAEVSMSDPTSVGAIVQLVIDLPQLQVFLHPELPERKPLVLVETEGISPDLDLEKFGEPVAIRDLDAAEGGPYLHLTKIEVSGNTAHVDLDYPIEGVGGEVEMARQDGTWRVTKAEVWER
jgi:hypothetical protein